MTLLSVDSRGLRGFGEVALPGYLVDAGVASLFVVFARLSRAGATRIKADRLKACPT